MGTRLAATSACFSVVPPEDLSTGPAWPRLAWSGAQFRPNGQCPTPAALVHGLWHWCLTGFSLTMVPAEGTPALHTLQWGLRSAWPPDLVSRGEAGGVSPDSAKHRL